MPLRYRILFPLVLLCLVFAAPAALALREAPTTLPLGDAVPQRVDVGSIQSHAGPCPLGPNGPVATAVRFLLPPDDQYYTLLDPALCQCGPAGASLNAAHVLLFFDPPCSIPVSVSIIGAATDPACGLIPDPSQVICPATTYVLDGSAGGLIDFALALPPGCCIQGRAFLCVNFLNSGSCPPGLEPGLVNDPSCEPCVSFNIYPGDPIARDLCTFYGFPGNPIMYVDASCCEPTPTLPGSWGMLKTLYLSLIHI